MQPPSPHTPENWSAASQGYHDKIAGFTSQYAEDLLERLELGGEHGVLEVAAGSGAVTFPLAARAARVLATDYAHGMVELLSRRVREAALENVSVRQMDGQALEVADASFDRAVSNFGVMLFADPTQGMRELCRALRPGGRAVISAWSTPDRFEGWSVFLGSMRRAFPDLPAPPGPPPIFSLASVDHFVACMREAGFGQVRVDSVTRMMETPSGEDYWLMLQGSAPPAMALMEQLGEAGRAHLHATMLEVLAERFGDGPVRLASEARIAVGVKAA